MSYQQNKMESYSKGKNEMNKIMKFWAILLY